MFIIVIFLPTGRTLTSKEGIKVHVKRPSVTAHRQIDPKVEVPLCSDYFKQTKEGERNAREMDNLDSSPYITAV